MSFAKQNAIARVRDIRESILGTRKYRPFAAVYWLRGETQEPTRIIDAKCVGERIMVRVHASDEWLEMSIHEMLRKDR